MDVVYVCVRYRVGQSRMHAPYMAAHLMSPYKTMTMYTPGMCHTVIWDVPYGLVRVNMEYYV